MWTELAAIGASSAGNILAGMMNNRAADKRQQNASMFDMYMYDTRYQNTVRDLKAAGLNPMLAYTQGAGSSPAVSAASSAGYGSIGSDAVGSFNDTRLASATEAKLKQDTMKSEAETKNIDMDTLGKAQVPALLAEQAVQAKSSAEQSQALTQKIRAEIPLVMEQIKNLQSSTEKNKSDVSLNKSLQEAQLYLNALRATETYLNQQTLTINEPKARAAKTTSGYRAAEAENQTRINKSFDDTTLPNPISGVTNLLKGGK